MGAAASAAAPIPRLIVLGPAMAAKRAGFPVYLSVTTKSWFHDDVPGGTVKVETEIKGALTRTTTMTAVRFEAKPAAEKPKKDAAKPAKG